MGNLLSSSTLGVSEDPVEKLRLGALQEIAARNKCFEESKQAYQKKQHSEAKQLSQQGKMHDAKAKELNAQAGAPSPFFT